MGAAGAAAGTNPDLQRRRELTDVALVVLASAGLLHCAQNFVQVERGRLLPRRERFECLDLLRDERFSTAEGVMTHADEIGRQITDAIAQKPYAYWTEQLSTLAGPWSPVQNPLEVANDPQVVANGYVVPITDADGNQRQLVANPVQFDETVPTLTRGPQFAEHTDDILRQLGKTEDEIIQLKVDGACT